MTVKRYGVCLYQIDAMRGISGSRQYETWADANKARTEDMRIWDHSTYPPTDVTDADPEAAPEMVWWAMAWYTPNDFWSGTTINHESGIAINCRTPGKIDHTLVRKQFPTGYTPTIHDLNEALEPYNVQVPVPEEPQWWRWVFNTNTGYKEWVASGLDYDTAEFKRMGTGVSVVRVWGTTADRDAKRDMLLEAAEKAGKA